MNRCLNADNFRQALAGVFRRADQVRAVLEQSKPVTADGTPAETLNARREFWLECHVRDFVIDQILSALNWQMRPWDTAGGYVAANLVTEQSPNGLRRFRAETDENRRRMDYLGYSRETDRPLIVVEAKRPNVQLPGVPSPLSFPERHPVGDIFAAALTSIRNGTDVPDGVSASWQKALEQIRGYCRTVSETRGEWPSRAVLTNGDWLIVFADPRNAFTATAHEVISAHHILVFESRMAITHFYAQLWDQLEYSPLAKEDRRLHVAQVRFVIDPACIESCAYGVRISYASKRTNYRKAPLISVSPLLFLRSNGGSFLQIATDWEDELPADGRESIADHLDRVQAECNSLKELVEQAVLGGRVLPLVAVDVHAKDTAAFRVRPLVQHIANPDGDTFLVFTGSSTHVLTAESGYAGCTFHKHASASATGVAQRGEPLLRSLLTPKSYFLDGSAYHCTHKAVYVVKQEQVTRDNRSRCGSRSCVDGGAFCEIAGFEEFLCCRICALHPACAKADAYSLPCRDLVELTRAGQPLAGAVTPAETGPQASERPA
ncbi:MAG: hypothetical protein JNM84_08960 [Planctomycetes bacterium]|nr:hypothetical protein [Planctomycetota bacterium]